jgi:hypothetical protein
MFVLLALLGFLVGWLVGGLVVGLVVALVVLIASAAFIYPSYGWGYHRRGPP